MGETTTYALSNVIADITALITGMISWMQSIVTSVTSNPLLLAFVLVAFIGIGISAFKRLTR